MAIKLKRGLKDGLPLLQQGEPAFTTDTKELFIGDGTDNILINKDVYTKTEVDDELALKADLVSGKVPVSQLPGFVDDVVMIVNSTIYSPDIPFPTGLSNTKEHRVLYFRPFAPAPNGGYSQIWVRPKMMAEWVLERNADTSEIYVALDTNKTYRMEISLAFPLVEISQSLALGETAQSAYYGDKGKVAYDHSQEQGNAHNLSPDEISYDGTISGLSSTNVKTAIDELASNITLVAEDIEGLLGDIDSALDAILGV